MTLVRCTCVTTFPTPGVVEVVVADPECDYLPHCVEVDRPDVTRGR